MLSAISVAVLSLNFWGLEFTQSFSREIEINVDDRASSDIVGPKRVEVQHILIGFKGSIAGKKISRSQQQAKELAHQLFSEIKKDLAQMPELIRVHSDDQYPGIYKLANTGEKKGADEFNRFDMVKAFGDKAFSLPVKEVGLVSFDESQSPYGFHILYRLK